MNVWSQGRPQWGSDLESPIPCTRKASVRQRHKRRPSFVTVLNKDDPPAERDVTGAGARTIEGRATTARSSL